MFINAKGLSRLIFSLEPRDLEQVKGEGTLKVEMRDGARCPNSGVHIANELCKVKKSSVEFVPSLSKNRGCTCTPGNASYSLMSCRGDVKNFNRWVQESLSTIGNLN